MTGGNLMPMRTLLVLPHMDDEAISCGGLIHRRAADGREQRTGSSPRAPANVVAQARVWGACCGCEFAEAYTLIHGAEIAG